jgi:hypothetical protein
MVLSLPHSRSDYAAVSFTAELANLLGIDLVGLFTADESLDQLASLPFAREFRHSGGWHPIDALVMEQSSGRAAAEARRLFREAVTGRPATAHFDMARGSIAESIGIRSGPDDIVAVIEPMNPAERVTLQFSQLLEAAFAAPSATLLIPSRVIRHAGPVVAIATGAGDSCIGAALRVAEMSHERLLLLVLPDADALAQTAITARVPVEKRRLLQRESGVPDLNSSLAFAGERLVVLSRGEDTSLLTRLAFQRSVPVLVTEPTAGRTIDRGNMHAARNSANNGH